MQKACAGIIFSIFFIFIAVSLSADWKQFRGNENRTGSSDGSLIGLSLKWQDLSNSQETTGYASPAALLINDHLYVYTCTPGGVLKAHDCTQNGNQAWLYNLHGRIINAITTGKCTVGEQAITTVFAVSNDGVINAINAVTGAQIWEVAFGETGFSPPLFYSEGANNYLILTANNGNVIKINADSGNILWNVTIGSGAAVMSGATYIPGSPGEIVLRHRIRENNLHFIG